jgi:RNA polymerase sigma-70 factor (ECF subfamily)
MYDFKTSTTVNQQNTKLDPQSFSALHDQYRDRLLHSMTGLVKDREAAADITASAFASAFKNLPSFRRESSFCTWLHVIALNEARSSWCRNRAVSLESIQGPEPKALIDTDEPAKTLERAELRLKMRKALQEIPAQYRRVLEDHFIRGRSVKQIARRERVPVGTVLSRIFAGKRLLRRTWEA